MSLIRRLRAPCALVVILALSILLIAPLRVRVLPWTANRLVEQTILTWPPWSFRISAVAAGEPTTIPADGRTLPAERFRPAGPARGKLLLVHGSIPKGCRYGPYRRVARAFADAGYEVLVPDIGGYGEAPIAPDAVPTFGADVAAAARALAGDDAGRVAIVGHSLGASMALEAVVRHGIRPTALVLWDPPVDIPFELQPANRAAFLNRRRSELRSTDGPSRAPDEALARYFASLAPQATLPELPATVPTLITLGSLIGSHAPIVAAVGIAPPRATILHLPTTDHFLSMTAVGGRTVYRPGALELFITPVERWLDRAGN